MKPFRSSGQSFNEIPLTDPKKSSFDLSYTNKGSGKIGRLIPVSQKECLPGDRMSCDVHSLLRFEPLAVPLLSDMNLRHHQYFVPFRQVWSSFESFITGGKDGYSDSHVVPQVSLRSVAMILLSRWFELLTTEVSPRSFVDHADAPFRLIDNVTDNAAFPYGKRLQRGFQIILKPDSSDLTRVDDSNVVWLWTTVNWFCNDFVSFFNDSANRSVFEKYFGQMDSLSLTSDPVMSVFDIYRYDVQSLLKKWSDFSLRPVFRLKTVVDGNASYITDFKSVFGAVEDFLHDLYDFIFSPFLGVSSTWDYLGYPCVFFGRSGYKGILSDYNQLDDIYRNNDDIYDQYNWSAVVNQGVERALNNDFYCSFLYINGDDVTFRFYLRTEGSHVDNFVKFSVLPLRAMYRIWYYNYRDQNLEANVLDPDSSAFKSDYGYDYILSLLMPRCCAWSKDTFTTATLQAYSTNLVVPIRDSTETQLEDSTLEVPIVDLPEGTSQNATIKIPTHFVQKDNSPLASISGLTLSNLRKVQALARWLDKNLFVGFQYADQLFSHYNVKYSDARLQIPEYLAGNSEIVRMEVITNNTSTTEQVAGDQVARAQGLTRSSVDGYFIEEHGLYFAIMSVLPDQSYPFGVDRSLLMTNKFDIAFPEFTQLGSDIVNTCEVFFDYADSSFSDRNFKAFGYQGRYYHYKYNRNEQHGELNTTRREWTFARFFDRAPVLNADFVHCTPNMQMFVSPYSDQFVYDVLINLRAQRSLPVYDQVL